jgi:uncharacterized membrane protein
MLDREGRAGLDVQPMLAAVSLCLIGLAVGLDVIGLAAGQVLWADLATWDIAAGLAVGLVGGAASALDVRRTRLDTGAFRRGLARAVLHGGAVGLLSLSLVLRMLDTAPSLAAVVFAALGLGLLLVARWLWGELHERAPSA